MLQQKISPARIFLLFSIIVGVSVILGFLLAIGRIGKINPSVVTNKFCQAKVLEECDGKRVSIIGSVDYTSKGPIGIVTDIQNRDAEYKWAGGIFLMKDGHHLNKDEGINKGSIVNITGIVQKGGQPCSPPGRPEQCLAPYHATRIEIESLKVIEERGIIVSTDKTEYEQGENIKITVKNDLNKPIWCIKEICPPSCCSLYRWENNEWKNLGDPMPCWSPPPLLPEESYGIEPASLEPEESIGREWNMTRRGEIAESGKYRFSFYYGLSENSYTEKTIYSNEFTIKEKSAIDPRCSQKLEGIGSCKMIKSGYEFDVSENKCVQKTAVNGCSFEIPFASLEECQITCETAEENRLSFETIIKDSYNNHPETKNYVIKNAVDWKNLLSKFDYRMRAPLEIDFTKDMIIAVFQGEKSTGGYSIEINRITEKENVIEVSILETSPGPHCMVTQALTSPFHIIKLAKQTKEVKFNVTKMTNNCEAYSQ